MADMLFIDLTLLFVFLSRGSIRGCERSMAEGIERAWPDFFGLSCGPRLAAIRSESIRTWPQGG
jgi:hypothetical protein